MRLSSKIKTTFALAAVLSTMGAIAWAQNLEVKGNAWFATGGSGSAGIGTNAPLGKLHVVAPGGFGAENADGTSQPGNVPIVAQGSSTVYGMLNSHGRQAGAINVNGDLATASARGYLTFYDKADGVWHPSVYMNLGNVGIGGLPGSPCSGCTSYKLDVGGDVHAAGWVRTDGAAGWYSQTYGGGWYMTDPTWVRTYGSRNVWTDGILGSSGGLTVGYGGTGGGGGGAVIFGNVGIGTSAPTQKLDVRGAIAAGNSDIYFTETNHAHVGFANVPGYAAIENSVNFGTLMILGRYGTSVGRRVDVWDFLQVNGNLQVTGQIFVPGATPVYVSGCGPNQGAITTSATCYDSGLGISLANAYIGKMVLGG